MNNTASFVISCDDYSFTSGLGSRKRKAERESLGECVLSIPTVSAREVLCVGIGLELKERGY